MEEFKNILGENFEEKKRAFLKLKWDADWALSPLPHAN